VPLALGIALGVVAAVWVAGCAAPSNNTTTTSGAATQTVPLAGVQSIISDWSESTHAVPVTFAAQEAPCTGCHDGRGFAMGVTDPKSFDASSPFGPYVVATDCRACHTGKGAELLKSGEVTTPVNTTPIKAGAGALCIGCHRERAIPPSSAPTPAEAPHPSVQAPVLLAYGGIRQPGVNYGSTTKHTEVKNLCVGCHMTDNAEGVASHTFMPGEPSKICGECHQGVTDFNRKAAADYDGNGQVQGIQDEVTGLLGKLNAATAKAMGAATLMQSQGQIVFKGSSGTTVTAPIPNKVWQAAYNWALITNDKSLGVHNPQFTVTLLQQSYKTLTGMAVPNSKPFPGSTGTTPSATTTP
jgi:hypothetical protein